MADVVMFRFISVWVVTGTTPHGQIWSCWRALFKGSPEYESFCEPAYKSYLQHNRLVQEIEGCSALQAGDSASQPELLLAVRACKCFQKLIPESGAEDTDWKGEAAAAMNPAEAVGS